LERTRILLANQFSREALEKTGAKADSTRFMNIISMAEP
jgi:hypothetical protein